jgi:hypothetical protein
MCAEERQFVTERSGNQYLNTFQLQIVQFVYQNLTNIEEQNGHFLGFPR